MNPASFALRKRTVMVAMTAMLIGAGILSYTRLGRLEDPTFTIKTALVVTPYPGASSLEVEEEVTDVVEEAIQQLGQLKEIRSVSQEGRSVIFVDIKDGYKSYELPQIWDELRRKVGTAQGHLPPGAGPCIVNDDFGDVYGVFFAVTGDGYSYADLKNYADDLKRELLLCDDVARVQLWGVQREMIYVEMDRAKMAELGLSPQAIFGTLHAQNLVTESGKVNLGEEYVRITPTGDFTSEEMIGDLLIGGPGSLVRLRDVATVRRGYAEPPPTPPPISCATTASPPSASASPPWTAATSSSWANPSSAAWPRSSRSAPSASTCTRSTTSRRTWPRRSTPSLST